MTQRRVRKAAENDQSKQRLGPRSEERNVVKKSKGRGADAHIQPRKDAEKPILMIAGYSSFHSAPPDEKIVKIISQIIRACYPGPHESYKAYPENTKNIVMIEFSKGKLDHEPKFKELFDATHKNKIGEYCSIKAKESIEKYAILMADKYGEDSSSYPDFDAELWNEASGGNLHGDNYGFGALGQTRAQYQSQPAPLPDETPIDPRVVEMFANLEKSMKKNMKKSMQKMLREQFMMLEITLLKRLAGLEKASEASTSSASRRTYEDLRSDDSDSDSDSDSSNSA